MKGRLELGDGDKCPLDPRHGQMYFIADGDRQWCAHQSHDGRPASSPYGAAPKTRCLWPKGDIALRKAIIETTLPQVSITLLGG